MSFELACNGTGLQELMHFILHNFNPLHINSWSHWPRALRRRSVAALACRDCGFESHLGQGRLSVVSVVWCQVEVSATS
jgi:hypothetical protein